METLIDKENCNIRVTEDGSKTLWSEFYGESYHSLNGAKSEVNYLAWESLGLSKFIESQKSVNFLEVGFGLGWCWRVMSEKFLKSPDSRLNLISLEKNKELIDLFEVENHVKFETNDSIKSDKNLSKVPIELPLKLDLKYLKMNNCELQVVLGDARDTVKSLKNNRLRFDFVYQDAFSPGRNPELWTEDWFRDLSLLMNPGAKLITYSSAGSVRRALRATGWTVESIMGFAGKRESLRAHWGGQHSDAN